MQAEVNRITQIRTDARNSQPVSSPEKRLVPPYPLCPISRVRMLQTKWASAPRKIETALGFVVLESYGAPAIIDCSGQIPKHRHAEDARKPHSHRVAHLLEADC